MTCLKTNVIEQKHQNLHYFVFVSDHQKTFKFLKFQVKSYIISEDCQKFTEALSIFLKRTVWDIKVRQSRDQLNKGYLP